MSKLKILTLLGILLILSSTYALEFDNKLSFYDEETKTATITNSILGVIETSKIADMKLETPLIVNTFAGYQKVAEFTIYNEEEYKDFFNSMEFYDLNRNQKEINRDFDFKYKEYYEITVNDYETSCKTREILDTSINATNDGTITEKYDCKNTFIGNHTETKFNWVDLNLDSLPKGKTEIGLFTEVKAGDRVEWIPKFFSVRLPQWAIWTAQLNDNIISFHKLNESTGTTSIDSVDGINNATLGSTSLWYGLGFINASINVAGTGTNYQTRIYNSSYFKFGEGVNYSFSVWVYLDLTTDGVILDNGGCGGSTTAVGLWVRNNKFQFGSGIGGGSENTIYSADNAPTGRWVHVVGTRAAGNYTVYVDGNFSASAVHGTGRDTSNQDATTDKNYLMMGWRSCNGAAGDVFLVGRIDEVGTWNRTLTPEEVTQLYNDGNGITYKLIINNPPTVTLHTPLNNTITNQTLTTFNCSASDDSAIQNISLYIDGSLNYTETFGAVNDTSISRNLILNEGKHNWTCNAYDDEGEIGTTNNRFIEIDSTNPVIVITYPIAGENIVTSTLPINVTLNITTIDVNIDKCWFYTSDNITIQFYDCNTTQYPYFEVDGEKTIFTLANDTLNNVASESVMFNISAFSYSQIESQDPTSEGTIIKFDIYVNKTNITTTNATFTYNNTVYLPDTITATTDYYYFAKTLIIQDGEGNSTGNVIPWYWEFTIQSSVNNFKTDNETLTVFSVEFDNCTTFTNPFIDIFLLDENTNTEIDTANNFTTIEINLNATNRVSGLVWNFNGTFHNDTNVSICVVDNVLNYSSFALDFVGSYIAGDYVKEFYYIDGKQINSSNVPEVINMRDLPLVDSTTFLFTFKDDFDFPKSNVVVEILRSYIGSGIYRIVEREITGSEGQTNIHLIEEDAIYRFNIYENEVLIFQSADYKALCDVTPCTIILTQVSGITSFDTNLNNIAGSYSWSSNSLTRTVSVNFTLEQLQTMNLSVYVVNQTSSQDILISSTSLTATSGILTSPTIPQAYGNQSFYGVLTTNNATQTNLWVSSKWIDFNQKLVDVIGIDAWFYAAFTIIVFALLGLATGPFVIIFTIVGLITLSLLSFINLQASIVLFIIGGLVIIWKMISRRY